MKKTILILFCIGFLSFGLVAKAQASTYCVSIADGDGTNCTGLSQTNKPMNDEVRIAICLLVQNI